MPLQPALLKTATQASDAFTKLERMVVTLELAPGLKLTEGELSDRMLMGRTPVREAVQRLSKIGLIVIEPRKGIRIAEINIADYLRVLRIRAHLEPLFAQQATMHATDQHRQSIRVCGDVMTESVVRNDMKLFLSADKVFDQVLAGAAGDRFLADALEPLQIHSRRCWYHYLGGDGVGESASLHLSVMEALLNRECARAEAAMRQLISVMIARTESMAGTA